MNPSIYLRSTRFVGPVFGDGIPTCMACGPRAGDGWPLFGTCLLGDTPRPTFPWSIGGATTAEGQNKKQLRSKKRDKSLMTVRLAHLAVGTPRRSRNNKSARVALYDLLCWILQNLRLCYFATLRLRRVASEDSRSKSTGRCFVNS